MREPGPRPEIRYENPQQCRRIYKIPVLDKTQMQSRPDAGRPVAGRLVMLVQVRVHGNSHSQNALAEKGKDTIAQRGDPDGAYIAHEKYLRDACLAFIKFI